MYDVYVSMTGGLIADGRVSCSWVNYRHWQAGRIWGVVLRVPVLILTFPIVRGKDMYRQRSYSFTSVRVTSTVV